MKTRIALYFLLLCTLPLFSQTNEATVILDKVSDKIRSYSAIEADFDMIMENVEEHIEERYAGKIYMKGMMYKLEIMDVINYFDGENLYTYMPDVEEVSIKLPSEEDEELLNPTTIFNIHNQGFKQSLISNTNGNAYIELYPEDKEKNFFKIGVWIDTKQNMIRQIKSFEKGGNNLILELKNIHEPQTIPEDSFFTFDATRYPNVEVIDLR